MFQRKLARLRANNSDVPVTMRITARRPGPAGFAIAAALALSLFAGTTALAATPCCGVTEIAANGQVTARELNGNRTIRFQVTDAALLRGLKPGAPVFANFDTGQVSLDGKRACCKITQVSVAAAQAPKTSVAASVPAVSAAHGSKALPQLSFGAPQTVSTPNWREGPQRLLQFQNKKTLDLRGLDSIKREPGLPQAAKDMLWLHARTLEAQELDGYIVIPEKAQEWSKTLPDSVREKLRKAATDDGKKKKKGCSTEHISTGCVQNEVEQAVDDVTNTARKAWQDIEDEWGRFMDNVEDAQACFEEKTLKARGPIRFTVAPQIPVSFEKDAKSSSKSGGASGKVTGTVTVGLPVTVDSEARFEAFYIPCMPFAVRPKSIGSSGNVDVEGIIAASITASGQYDYLFTVPPTGGIQIPVVVIPVVLAGVPIAILDASVYLDGTLQVDGKGTVNGNLKLQSLQQSAFSFECSSFNCDLDTKSAPAPTTAVESVTLEGRIHIKPAIYAALQLGLNYNLLNARAGPQPYLLGEVYGCGAATGAQSTAGTSSGEQFHALTADIDWGIEVRAEALAGGQKVAKKTWNVMQQHIAFRDLGNSTALRPSVAGTTQPSATQTTAFIMKMPTCYPYSDSMTYRVSWTGNASAPAATSGSKSRTAVPAATSGLKTRTEVPGKLTGSAPSNCDIGSGNGTCQGGPQSDTSLYLVWPAPGNYSLTVSPYEDKHGRRFSASSATQTNLNILP
jgi:Cu/Ag efflux protein CusF